MSLKISEVGGYGTGTLGEVTAISGNINSYARVTAVGTSTITIILQAASTGAYGGFEVGTEILFHVSGSTGTSYTTYLGKWAVAKITAISGDVLTVDKNLTSVIPSDQVARYYCQAVTIPHFKNLTLETGTQIQPIAYSATNYYGGIVALKCSDTLTFDGGNINLNDMGIPVASKALRPVTSGYEVKDSRGYAAYLDKNIYAGWENFMTKEQFTLQAGDGAAFIVAKNFVCSEDSRIGNINSYGSAFCRGASDSVGTKPANVTNVGGSSIFVVADSIENFTQKMFAKYRSSTSTAGQGICRCYIATNTTLPNDEGLYSYDNISNPQRVMRNFNIRNFGDGTLGDLSEPTIQLNNYARVTAVSSDRKKISYTGKTTTGLSQIVGGALVMIHANHKDSSNVEHSGKFILAKVLSDNGSDLTLDHSVPTEINPDTYAVQVVSVVQANSFTLTKENKATPKFDGKIGGILALAVKGTCNLTGGKLNVGGKGGGTAYGKNGLQYISNSGMCDRLPIGQGQGSVFLLTKTLTMNNKTRIGATYSGASLGGAGWNRSSGATKGGGYRGADYEATAGSGAGGGVAQYNLNGGYGSNGAGRTYGGITRYPYQGAHILIVADTINNFFVNAISTGGQGASTSDSWSGGAGYGGGGSDNGYGASGGGYNGGGGGGKGGDPIAGGGGSGWAFIFCNNAVNPTYTNVKL